MILRRILWIDDMMDWSGSAQYLLNVKMDTEKYSMDILHRKNGENIIQDLMMHNFDLVLMDYHMDPFNGDKYINDIHYDMTFAYLPIMFYSQDPTVNLADLVKDFAGVQVCHRSALVDLILERFFSA